MWTRTPWNIPVLNSKECIWTPINVQFAWRTKISLYRLNMCRESLFLCSSRRFLYFDFFLSRFILSEWLLVTGITWSVFKTGKGVSATQEATSQELQTIGGWNKLLHLHRSIVLNKKKKTQVTEFVVFFTKHATVATLILLKNCIWNCSREMDERDVTLLHDQSPQSSSMWQS